MTKGRPQYRRGVSPIMLTLLEPHRDAVIEAWRQQGLVAPARHYGISPASLRLVLLSWLGAEVYEHQAYLHRAKRGVQDISSHLRVWPTIVPRIPVRRWPEFTEEEQAALQAKVRTWLLPEVAARERLAAMWETKE